MINKKIKKLLWKPEEEKFLLLNSKTMNLTELAAMLNKTVSLVFRDDTSIKKRCTIIGCGYTNKL